MTPEPAQNAKQAEKPAATQPDDAPAMPKPKGKRLSRFITTPTLGVLVIVLLVVQGMGLAYFIVAQHGATKPDAEIALGPQVFSTDPAEQSQIGEVSFSLFVAPIGEVDREARQRLVQRKHRVQQDIEELLRQAHGGDFLDPTLGELKRRIQERINRTLEMRAVADVIITDLRIRRGGTPEKPPASETAGTSPWPTPSSH
ncbi:MAG: hypothetical protein JW809_15660 [Pirellulales bacterium]|nr:hypothetical protein [Pirellulales bacterium]